MTIPRDVEAIPGIVDDDETTIPVDVEEMELAAKRSCDAPDGPAPPRILRRAVGTDNGAGGRPTAAVEIAGAAEVVNLVAHGVSETGASLAIPPEVDVTLKEGASLMVSIGAAEARARLPAVVAFVRESRNGRPGGVSIRWDTARGISPAEVASAIRRINAAG